MAASKVEFWTFLDTDFFTIAGTLKGETSMSGKAVCLLAIGEDKKVNFLE